MPLTHESRLVCLHLYSDMMALWLIKCLLVLFLKKCPQSDQKRNIISVIHTLCQMFLLQCQWDYDLPAHSIFILCFGCAPLPTKLLSLTIPHHVLLSDLAAS